MRKICKKRLAEHIVITKITSIDGKFQIFSFEKYEVKTNWVVFIKNNIN